MRTSKVPALIKIDDLARKMSIRWMQDKSTRENIGEQEYAFRMFRAMARDGRKIGQQEIREKLSIESSIEKKV